MERKKTYSEGHVLAMFEEIKSQGNIVIEQYSGLSEKVGSLTEKVDLILEDIDEIKSNIVDIKAELGMKANKEVADDHEKRIVKLEKASLAAA